MVLKASPDRGLAGFIAAYHVVIGVGSLILYGVGGLGGFESLAWLGGSPLVGLFWPVFVLGPFTRMAGVIGGVAFHGRASFAKYVLGMVSILDALVTGGIGLMLTLVGGVFLGVIAFCATAFSIAAAAIVFSDKTSSGSKQLQDMQWRRRRQAFERRSPAPEIQPPEVTPPQDGPPPAATVDPPPGETPSFRVLEVVPLFDRPRPWWTRTEPEAAVVPASVRACGLALVLSSLFGVCYSATALQSAGGRERSVDHSSYHSLPDLTPVFEYAGEVSAATAIAGMAVFSLLAGLMCIRASRPPYRLGMAASITTLMVTAWLLRVSNAVESIQITLLQVINFVVLLTLLVQKHRNG